MGNELIDEAIKMDDVLGSISILVESLEDVNSELGLLRQRMDEGVYRGNVAINYIEQHRTVRMLHDLMNYLMNDLAKASEQACKLGTSLYENSQKVKMPIDKE